MADTAEIDAPRTHIAGCILEPDHGAGCVRQQWASDDPDAPWNRVIPPGKGDTPCS